MMQEYAEARGYGAGLPTKCQQTVATEACHGLRVHYTTQDLVVRADGKRKKELRMSDAHVRCNSFLVATRDSQEAGRWS